jgi:hypothetical protein
VAEGAPHLALIVRETRPLLAAFDAIALHGITGPRRRNVSPELLAPSIHG